MKKASIPYVVEMSWGTPPRPAQWDVDPDFGIVMAQPSADASEDPEWRSFDLHGAHWEALLVLGQRHGWVPAGTQGGPDTKEAMATGLDYEALGWEAYKVVEAADAAAWADALERALEAHRTGAERLPHVKGAPVRILWAPGEGVRRRMTEAVVTDFVAFLREGAFRFAGAG